MATELVIENVTAGYAGIPVVSELSFTLRVRERMGIIGRNGAGKTTTLAMVMGLSEQLGGRVSLNGTDISKLPPWKRSRAGIGYVPQSRDIFASLTVEENLLAALNGKMKRNEALELSYNLFPRLCERRRNGGTQLSGGEQQMLAVARAMVGKPDILLLDEPLEGLAPMVRIELMQAIQGMSKETGIGCLLVEQQVDVVLDFATSVIVLEHGVPVYCGTAEKLKGSPEILNHTIGLGKV